jgi:Zn-finger nucleic acid-binding protein
VRIEADQVFLARGEIEKVLEPTFGPPAPAVRTRRKMSSQNNEQQQDQEQVDESDPEQVTPPE